MAWRLASGIFSAASEGRKHFFSVEKKQKTFIRWARPFRKGRAQRMKVFWFFFTKKNRLLAYQLPTLGMLTQGSAGASAAPACSSSMDIPSGVRMNAIRPSRGGRLITTPWAIMALQVS